MKDETTARRSAYPAALGWRMLAMLYDAVPLLAILMLSSFLLLLLHGGKPAEANTWLSALHIFVYFMIVGLYAVISWRLGGQTMGMRPWRLLVVDKDGKSPTLKSLWLRYFIVALFAGLPMLWCLINKEKRGLHDIASGTFFVRMQANVPAEINKH
jgi:uncharacterized RDD family membrane protein YckC